MALNDDFQTSELVDFDGYADPGRAAISSDTYAHRRMQGDDFTGPKWSRISRSLLGQEKAIVADAEIDLDRLFKRLAKKAFAEFGPSSDISRLFASSGYLEIIGLGQQIVPQLLRDMQRTRRPWFVALAAITRGDPAKTAEPGDIRGMTDAWLGWGKRKKLI